MTERGLSVPGLPSPPPTGRPRRPHSDVISAISELADHVRAYGLYQADEVLTDLLALLYAEQDD
ncbi:hypothetical protein [Roseomonas chloroacetimidivorans]|uniref:hypothetical protein n=1 Tax=Roseomonas chloroacetimidivorans TaxID=1766656 RepID=UPI003C71C23A